MSKKFITIVSIVLILFSVSMLLASFVFKPVVTLDYRYSPLDWNYDGKGVSAPNYTKERVRPVRFSHYQAPSLFRKHYTFAGWYKDVGFTVAWINGEDTVPRNMTLYAKWVKNA